jgi:hypothetical protein
MLVTVTGAGSSPPFNDSFRRGQFVVACLSNLYSAAGDLRGHCRRGQQSIAKKYAQRVSHKVSGDRSEGRCRAGDVL